MIDNLKLLGLKVKDKVTGFSGVVTSISFDLYGCVQAIVHPGIGKDGKALECHWFDVGRLEILSKKPVMQTPTFQKKDEKGPAEKPSFSEQPR